MADTDSPARRTLRGGRYVVLGQLGSGAQGTTWDGVDTREGRAVAIKQFEIRGAKAWKDVELAEREARVLASLSHPKLPAYVEHFEEDGVLYLVMQKIEGTPLSELRRRGPLAEGDVMRLLRDADDVLVYLHGRAPPVIHRDLKPSNVIRRPDGSFAFVDFGAVRDRMRPEGGSTVVGTFGYMAPEQFQGRAGPGSDVYAIGATALSMLTGLEPEALPHRGLGIDVGAALFGRANPTLGRALARMLEIDPDRRATRIGPLLRGDDAAAPSSGRPSSAREWADVGQRIKEQVERDVRRQVEQATRQVRRAEKNARRREQRRAARRASGGRAASAWRAPWFVIVPLSIALLGAALAVTLALRIVVPLVLVVLSIVFGAGLRRAARNVSRAGAHAQDAIRSARVVVHGGRAQDDGIRARIVDETEGRTRLAEGDDDELGDDDDEGAGSEARGRTRR